MFLTGTIQNGQVVLDAPTDAPDGTRVWVEAVPTPDRPREEVTPQERLRREMIRQGTKPHSNVEDLLGVGEDWWTDDEFEAFLRHVRRSRGHHDA